MLVRDVMTHNAHYCTRDQFASDAARAMDQFDIGSVPIVDENLFPIAMVTDRDLAIGAYRSSLPLKQIAIREVMSRGIFSCKAADTVSEAERIMRDWQVRRLPVVAEDGKLIGVLSLSDIVLACQQSSIDKLKHRVVGDLDHTMAAVCRQRSAPVGVQF